ncbi:sigma-70 family RNA polymerase sigma factor [Robiginitalea sp. IMCC43444]|uniref:sigma-70 family RNA polymerase sigma factor n=1 Tax=Robiginitalea sp. IMCC43444 TaxID=3459121 RepID=UPI0040429B7D
MKDTLLYDKRQAAFHHLVADSLEELKALKASGAQKAFNEKLLRVLPEVKRYITRSLRLALAKGMISHNKYRPDDFFDQLFIEVYDHLDEVSRKEEFHPWLFRQAEKLLDEMELEEIFEATNYDNIDDYYRAEMESLEEAFSTDGDGDLVMMEELDDLSYKNHHYLLKNIFLDDAHEDLMALTETVPGKEKIQESLKSILYAMPADTRSVFELATEQLFNLDEISMIKNLPKKLISDMIENARRLMRASLEDQLFDN